MSHAITANQNVNVKKPEQPEARQDLTETEWNGFLIHANCPPLGRMSSFGQFVLLLSPLSSLGEDMGGQKNNSTS